MGVYPIFVIEGPDGGGKTTLAKTLVEKLGGIYMHSTYRFKGHMYAYHIAQLRNAVRYAQMKPVVMDRWWPSEIVYGNTYRAGPEPGYDYKALHEVAKQYGVSYVFACPTRWEQYWEWYSAHYSKDKEMYPLSEAHCNMVWMNYRNIMLREYHEFDREILHYYSVVLDAYRCQFFADHIIDRYRYWIKQQSAERKQAIRDLSANWQMIGRIKPAPIPETYHKPIQGSFL